MESLIVLGALVWAALMGFLMLDILVPETERKRRKRRNKNDPKP